MTALIRPDSAVRASYLAAMAEFAAEGRGTDGDTSMLGRELRTHGAHWRSAAGFERFVRALRADALEETPRAENWVPCTTLWWVDGVEFLGRIAIRHRLTPALRAVGGHIGYDVRPSARGRGHGTAMLATALPVAATLGIDPALITCDADNIASRRVIERNGGEPAASHEDKLRYWVPTL